MSRRPIRIASFSGYLGDRFTALDDVMTGDEFDVVVGDYLAEITLAALSAQRAKNPAGGYVRYFLEQLRPHIAQIADQGCKVVVNAGGFNPAGLAEAVRTLIGEAGIFLRVAHIEGDNVLARLPQLHAEGHALENMDSGSPLADWGFEPIAANAYLGAWGIAAALRGGADIVICGRITDASLVVGAAAWWHDWDIEDWDQLAGAVVAGHIIECGGQATGGNFSGFTTIEGVLEPGFPIAEVAEDGSCVITKHCKDGGEVTVDTVTAQLVYEIQGPLYLNPDVTVHLEGVRLHQAAPDRVLVGGAAGSPPPPTTKVAVFAEIGYQVVLTVFATGLDVQDKVDLLRAQITALAEPGIIDLDVTPIGTVAQNPDTQWDATVAVRVIATARQRDPLTFRNFASRISGLYLSSFPGFYQDTGAQRVMDPQVRIDYWPALLPTSALDHVVVFDDGTCMTIAPPAVTEVVRQPSHPEPSATQMAPMATRQVPLGTIAHARSGDKGGNSNVGIWVGTDAAWLWLRYELTTERLRSIMPEVKGLDIVRHEFPHLRAIHFVLRGLLGTGGSSNLRVDQVGKAVGEYLRAKHVDIPTHLLPAREVRHAH
ncbi:acyclic terpene utilization AtuA family protein [Nocardia xishanensis]|uniref:Acyclic terpene utilization AtuA family protein n=1 Tax=Nocardia xishanensis TaxID=238964 RepID=A0ABW7XC22_9NOCA